MITGDWRVIAQQARDYRDASLKKLDFSASGIPAELPQNVTTIPKALLSETDFNITRTLPEDLVKSLSSGELSSVDVTTAFLRRAVIAQHVVSQTPP